MRVGTPVDSPGSSVTWPITADGYHQFIEELCENIPEGWDDDVAVEAIILSYVRHLESLVTPDLRVPVAR